VISRHSQIKFDSTVLILGSNSFIGKNIITEVPFKQIICIQKKKQNIVKKKNLKYYFFNLHSSKELIKVITKYNFDKIIICASNNNNSKNLKNNNSEIFFNNTNVLLNTLECVKFKKKIEIINFTSTEVQKKKKSIYSIAKKTNDELCKFYKDSYGLKIKNLVLSNLFGKNDLNFNRIIPSLIRNIFLKRKIILNNHSIKLQFIHINQVLKVITNKSKYIKKKKLISVNQIKNKILYLMKLKKGLSKKNFDNSFEYNLYETINWYIKYFKKKL
jgi:nucleoside-diphosphate-sugar epimerase